MIRLNPEPDGLPIAVVGGGYMGVGMALVFALSGSPVKVCDASAEDSQNAVARARREARELEDAGHFPEGSSQTVVERITAASTMEQAVDGAAYVAEVVPEVLAIKKSVLERLSAAAAPDTLIASNTSAIPITELQAFVRHPERFAGAHWMNPAPLVPCVEIIAGAATSASTMAAVERLIKATGKQAIVVPDSAGFIANRLQFALFREAARIVEEGLAEPETIDAVVTTSFGYRLPFVGPFRGADMAGLDIYVGAFQSLQKAYGERFAPPQLLLDMVGQGRMGIKSGSGLTISGDVDAGELVARRNRAYAELDAVKSAFDGDPARVTDRDADGEE